MLQDIYGASPQAFSVLFAANALGIVGASQANRALLLRFEPRAILRAALSVQASAGVTLLAVVLAGAGVWGIVPLLFVDAVCELPGELYPDTLAIAPYDDKTIQVVSSYDAMMVNAGVFEPPGPTTNPGVTLYTRCDNLSEIPVD